MEKLIKIEKIEEQQEISHLTAKQKLNHRILFLLNYNLLTIPID
jgi:hypothetical protein